MNLIAYMLRGMRCLPLIFAILTTPTFAASVVPANGVISSSGSYYLTGDVSGAGTSVIQINASNVALDLRGRAVRCEPSNPATAVTFGVKVNAGNNIIRNGKITGCFMGVHASGSSGNTIEDIDFTGNTYIGVHGGTVVRGNTFDAIAGYTIEPYAIGVNTPGANCLVTGNTFRNMHRQPISDPSKIGEGVGVLLNAGSAGCLVEANWFENASLGPEQDIGVWVAVGGSATIERNSFTNFGWSVANRGDAVVSNNRFWMREAEADSVAIDGDSTSAVTTASGNVIIGYDDPLLGNITDAGNLILP